MIQTYMYLLDFQLLMQLEHLLVNHLHVWCEQGKFSCCNFIYSRWSWMTFRGIITHVLDTSLVSIVLDEIIHEWLISIRFDLTSFSNYQMVLFRWQHTRSDNNALWLGAIVWLRNNGRLCKDCPSRLMTAPGQAKSLHPRTPSMASQPHKVFCLLSDMQCNLCFWSNEYYFRDS